MPARTTGLILVLGGELPPDHTFPENEAYDPNTDSWATLSPMPQGRHGFGGDEQNVRMSLEVADHAYVLDNGHVVYSGSARPRGR
ncbi:MAG: kelch repeat-containing protein [Xanthobacteraceae bacterium]